MRGTLDGGQRSGGLKQNSTPIRAPSRRSVMTTISEVGKSGLRSENLGGVGGVEKNTGILMFWRKKGLAVLAVLEKREEFSMIAMQMHLAVLAVLREIVCRRRERDGAK